MAKKTGSKSKTNRRKKKDKIYQRRIVGQKYRRAEYCQAYLTSSQEELVEKTFGCTRLVHNKTFYMKKDRYDRYKESIAFGDLQKMVTFWKETDELDFLNEVPASALTHTVMNLQKAYENFYDGAGFPKFKKKTHEQSFTVYEKTNRVNEDETINLPKFGDVKISGLKNKTPRHIGNVTVKKKKNGKYFISFSEEITITSEKPKVEKIEDLKINAIDVNLENFLTDMNGNRVENPRFKKHVFDKIKYYNQRMSACVKGSNGWNKWRLKIAKVFDKVNNQKLDFLHKLTTNLVKNHDMIFHENLVITNMVKNHCLAESISQVSWGTFFQMLKYKGVIYDCYVIGVDPKGTSKECSKCGHIEKLTLADREWTCPNCKTVHIRDQNAAINCYSRGWGTPINVDGKLVLPQVLLSMNRLVSFL